MKTICLHHTDIDGKMSGAIVRKYHGEDTVLIPMDYNKPVPWGSFKYGDRVVIVDFSIEDVNDMDRLINIADKVIWIDHHKSAIAKYDNYHTKIPGTREDGVAGCELTWKYFFPDRDVPAAVKLAADYDIWKFAFGDETSNFQTGLRLEDTRMGNLELWNTLLDHDVSIDRIIRQGEVVTLYNKNTYRSLIRSWGYWVEFEGKRCLACNQGSVPSLLFESVEEDYAISIPYVFDGKKYKVTLFGKNPDVDCSKLAVKHGGGGHHGAAGFYCNELPFKFIGKFKK